MTNAQSLIDRIKRLSSDFINGGNTTPNRPRSDGVEMPLAPVQRGRVQSTSYNVHAGNPGQRVMSPRAFAGVGRLRFGNQGGVYGAEHTQSNLG